MAKCEIALITQFLRSGTSIGANIREAFYAHGKADFIAKLQIALKECSETEYWIELVLESGYYLDKTLLDKCTELKRILISSINESEDHYKEQYTRQLPKSFFQCMEKLLTSRFKNDIIFLNKQFHNIKIQGVKKWQKV